jgi:AAA domain
VKTRLVTAGVGAAWEAALVRACQAGQVPAQVLHRCYDLGDLLAVAAAGQAEVAVVAAGTRWLDRDALARLTAAGLAVVGVASAGDEDSERRLRQLGLLHIASDEDPPDILVDRARAALAAEPDPDDEPPVPDEAPAPPDGDTRRVLAAVWGPKGGPGRTTVAVNLAFEAAAIGGEVLLVDADTYGGAVAHANIHEHHTKLLVDHEGRGRHLTCSLSPAGDLQRRAVPPLSSPPWRSWRCRFLPADVGVLRPAKATGPATLIDIATGVRPGARLKRVVTDIRLQLAEVILHHSPPLVPAADDSGAPEFLVGQAGDGSSGPCSGLEDRDVGPCRRVRHHARAPDMRSPTSIPIATVTVRPGLGWMGCSGTAATSRCR